MRNLSNQCHLTDPKLMGRLSKTRGIDSFQEERDSEMTKPNRFKKPAEPGTVGTGSRDRIRTWSQDYQK